MIAKKNISKFFYLFLFFHLFLWTVVPTISNINLPLDTIEALAWGSDLKWGFNKHPPLSAFVVEIFYKLFGNQDWAFYFLSQIFVITSFFVVYVFSKDFFKDTNLAFFSVLLLEGIFFFNFTSPEFNVNIAQLPFWALSILFTWRCIKSNKITDFILLGFILGLGVLSKYLFVYLIIGIIFLFIYFILRKKIAKLHYFFLTGIVTLLILSPHFIWLVENNFVTIKYGLQRTGGIGEIKDHIIYPVSFIIKQTGILIPFFITLFFLLKSYKTKKITIDDKKIFLFFTCLLPILLLIFTSIIMGAKIRTMWMTPFYLIIGVAFIEMLKNNVDIKNLKKFYCAFLFFFLISPMIYLFVSLTNDNKRTDYPGKEIARLVQNRWDENFSNQIKFVIGDEWFAGNLSYHLDSRPRWIMDFKERSLKLKSEEGVIYTGNPKILKKVCPGVFGTIKPVGYCMIGVK